MSIAEIQEALKLLLALLVKYNIIFGATLKPEVEDEAGYYGDCSGF